MFVARIQLYTPPVLGSVCISAATYLAKPLRGAVERPPRQLLYFKPRIGTVALKRSERTRGSTLRLSGHHVGRTIMLKQMLDPGWPYPDGNPTERCSQADKK